MRRGRSQRFRCACMSRPAATGHRAERSTSPTADPAWLERVRRRAARLRRVALTNMQTGLHGDPRTTNPDPGPAPYPPFLGVTNWPLVTSVTSAVLTLAFFGYLGWQSIRRRRPHWLLIVGIAAFFAGALDPLANWATFAVFDPRVAHFPAVVALLQRLAASGADAVVPRRIRELLRADRARPPLAPSAVHRAAYPSQRVAGPAPTCGRLHHRIRCGTSAQRAHAVHVVEGRPVRLHRGGGPGAASLRQAAPAVHGDLRQRAVRDRGAAVCTR